MAADPTAPSSAALSAAELAHFADLRQAVETAAWSRFAPALAVARERDPHFGWGLPNWSSRFAPEPTPRPDPSANARIRQISATGVTFGWAELYWPLVIPATELGLDPDLWSAFHALTTRIGELALERLPRWLPQHPEAGSSPGELGLTGWQVADIQAGGLELSWGEEGRGEWLFFPLAEAAGPDFETHLAQRAAQLAAVRAQRDLEERQRSAEFRRSFAQGFADDLVNFGYETRRLDPDSLPGQFLFELLDAYVQDQGHLEDPSPSPDLEV
jgi:hypothetical protein